MKTATFIVEGIGEFEFRTELPHTESFFDRRKKIAAVLGGMRDLLTIESLRDEGMMVDPAGDHLIFRPEADSLTRQIALKASSEFVRAANMTLMADHITKYPQGKRLEQLTVNEFAAVEKEFTAALDSFRTPDKAAPGTSVASDVAGNGPGQTT